MRLRLLLLVMCIIVAHDQLAHVSAQEATGLAAGGGMKAGGSGCSVVKEINELKEKMKKVAKTKNFLGRRKKMIAKRRKKIKKIKNRLSKRHNKRLQKYTKRSMRKKSKIIKKIHKNCLTKKKLILKKYQKILKNLKKKMKNRKNKKKALAIKKKKRSLCRKKAMRKKKVLDKFKCSKMKRELKSLKQRLRRAKADRYLADFKARNKAVLDKMRKQKSPKGTLIDSSPSGTIDAITLAPSDGAPLEGSPSSLTGSAQGPVHLLDQNYPEAVYSRVKLNHNDAITYCQKYGGLLKLKNATPVPKAPLGIHFWISGHRKEGGGLTEFVDLTGLAVQVPKWLTGQPDNNQVYGAAGEQCLGIYQGTDSVNDYNCALTRSGKEEFRALCEGNPE